MTMSFNKLEKNSSSANPRVPGMKKDISVMLESSAVRLRLTENRSDNDNDVKDDDEGCNRNAVSGPVLNGRYSDSDF